MKYAPAEYAIPASPPDELLAELDAAARTLDELASHEVELTLDVDAQTGRIRIEFVDEEGPRAMTPSELFALLAADEL